MIYKRRKAGTSRILITFELPVELRDTRCSLVGDFNNWDATADVFGAGSHYRITKEFDYGTEHEFSYLTDGGMNFQDRSSDGVRGEHSLVIAKVSEPAPFSAFGLNLSFIQEQLIGIALLLAGFVATLYIFGIYMAFHGVSFSKLLTLPVLPNFADEASKIVQGAGYFDFVSFRSDGVTPTLFAMFLEIYTWSALGVLASQVYHIYQDVVAPGPVLTLSHVASWLQAIIARPPIAAVIILLIQALEIKVAGHSLSSITGVISIAFLAGFSSSFSDRLVLVLVERIEKSVELLRTRQQSSSKNAK